MTYRRQPLDDYPVVMYTGLDYARAIEHLIHFADPRARVEIPPTGHTIPKLAYRRDEDWMAAANQLAMAIGKRLHQITDVWVLAPRCGCHDEWHDTW